MWGAAASAHQSAGHGRVSWPFPVSGAEPHGRLGNALEARRGDGIVLFLPDDH